ncbi:death domain-containing protein 1 isoform X1 [Pseudorasbora parva]|uniref:death domain-containing protein 1 isoform X1 n=1 Tax=Pseudorasbora parva TaxID=51549 RepID=UPI00351F601C
MVTDCKNSLNVNGDVEKGEERKKSSGQCDERLKQTLATVGARTVCQPVSVKAIQHSQTDPLSDELLSWLCDELTEDDAALLVTSLHLRRSAVQIASTRAPHSLSKQAFHILTAWRRGRSFSSPKCPMLAQFLTSAGRPELARELLLREAANYKMEERKARET